MQLLKMLQMSGRLGENRCDQAACEVLVMSLISPGYYQHIA